MAADRPPLPEPLLTESATDVDAEEVGEKEFEANVATVGARSGGARATLASLEVEWRLLQEFGVRLEPSYARVVDPGGVTARDRFGFGGALALGLFHDFARDLHVQAELLGRTPESANERVFEPGESELPLAADVVSAVRAGFWTIRATVGAEAGGSFAHAPLHTDMAALVYFANDWRFGFAGVEVRADWAREAPLVIAPDVVAITTPLGLPFSLSLALPVNLGAVPTATSYGIFMRLMLLAGRETEYGRDDEGRDRER
jgi:hypothetical protein